MQVRSFRSDEQIAPLFHDALYIPNILLPEEFVNVIDED